MVMVRWVHLLVHSIGFLQRVQLGIRTDRLRRGFVELVVALITAVPRNLSRRTTVIGIFSNSRSPIVSHATSDHFRASRDELVLGPPCMAA